MNHRVVTIGEALIDFIPVQKGLPLRGVTQFERAAGGAPANVAAAVAKLGGEAAVITQLGRDAFGDFLVDTMEQAGVDTSSVFRTADANTGLAFVSLSADGDRSFSFYRKPCADLLLSPEQITPALLAGCAALHFCSVDLVESPMKQAHKKAIALAAEQGALISFDPNVRLPLWDDPEDCRRAVHEFLPLADLVKISDDELAFLFGTDDPRQAANRLFAGRCKALLYTKGPNGAALFTKNTAVSVAGINTAVADTTGAGDSFVGAVLYQLSKDGAPLETLARLSAGEAAALVRFANFYAAYTTMGKGAIDAMGTMQQARAFISQWESAHGPLRAEQS